MTGAIFGVSPVHLPGKMGAIRLVIGAGDDLALRLEMLAEMEDHICSPDPVGVGKAGNLLRCGGRVVRTQALALWNRRHFSVAVKDTYLRVFPKLAAHARDGKISALASQRIVIGNGASGAAIIHCKHPQSPSAQLAGKAQSREGIFNPAREI